jgi:hypothetical protein
VNKQKSLFYKVLLLGLVIFGLTLFTAYYYKKFKYSGELEYVGLSSEVKEGDLKMFSGCLGKEENSPCLTKVVLRKFGVPFNEEKLREYFHDIDIMRKLGLMNSNTCHTLSHKVGEQSYLHARNYEDLLNYDVFSLTSDGNCTAGYYHGVFIEFSKHHTDSDLKKLLVEIIERYEPYVNGISIKDKWRQGILHGVGHVLYYIHGDPEDSIKDCKELSNNPKVLELCYTGVYMERVNETQDLGIKLSIAECNQFPEESRSGCFSGHSVRTLDVFEDVKKYSDICNVNSNREIYYSCMKSFMYRIFRFGFTDYDKKAKTFCDLQNGIGNKITCLEIYDKVTKVFSVNVKNYKQEKVTENLCTSLDVISYLRCRQYFERRQYAESDFSRVNEDFISGTPSVFPLNIRYFFDNL